MFAVPQTGWTREAYLAFEDQHEERHEYIDGKVIARVPSSEKHILISGNVFATLHSQLRQRAGFVFTGNMRVSVNHRDYVYPDLGAVIGETLFEDKLRHNLVNPTVLLEVSSPETEGYDRGKRFQLYRTIPSLQEHVLISQDQPLLESFLRLTDEQWLVRHVVNLDASFALDSIGCTLALRDVYEQVTFDSEST